MTMCPTPRDMDEAKAYDDSVPIVRISVIHVVLSCCFMFVSSLKLTRP